MKTNYYFTFFVFLLLSASTTTAQLVPNSGFETWLTDGDQNVNPESWETSNAYPLVSADQFTPAYSGNFSMRVKAFNNGLFNMGGLASTQFPFTQRPTHLRVCLRATIMPGDTVLILFAATLSGNPISA